MTRVARMGKTLTFVDVHAREAMCDARGNATTTVFCKIISEPVPKTVRKGLWCRLSGRRKRETGTCVGTRTGAYVEARDVRVERAAPVASVANATGEMLARYGKRSSRGLIDVTKSETGSPRPRRSRLSECVRMSWRARRAWTRTARRDTM